MNGRLRASEAAQSVGGIRVALVGGGANSEHEVSMASADSVEEVLIEAGFQVERLDLDRGGRWCLPGGVRLEVADAVRILTGCDVLFPMVHGPHGEDGTLAGFAEMLRLPCVGSGVGAGALAMDKWATKLVAQAVGVRVARGELLGADSLPVWRGPCVVKPVAAGSSQGVHLVRDPARFQTALHDAFGHDDRILVEEVLQGREIDLAVLRRGDGSLLVSAPLEIRTAGFFDYEAKYDGSAQFVIPAPLGVGELAGLEEAARRVFTALGCAGVARVDFFLTREGWVLNEVNTIPGMTAQSQVPRMFGASGVDYPDLLGELVHAALRTAPAPAGAVW